MLEDPRVEEAELPEGHPKGVEEAELPESDLEKLEEVELPESDPEKLEGAELPESDPVDGAEGAELPEIDPEKLEVAPSENAESPQDDAEIAVDSSSSARHVALPAAVPVVSTDSSQAPRVYLSLFAVVAVPRSSMLASTTLSAVPLSCTVACFAGLDFGLCWLACSGAGAS